MTDPTLTAEYQNDLTREAREMYRGYLKEYLTAFIQGGSVVGQEPYTGDEKMMEMGATYEDALVAAVQGPTTGERSAAQHQLQELMEMETTRQLLELSGMRDMPSG